MICSGITPLEQKGQHRCTRVSFPHFNPGTQRLNMLHVCRVLRKAAQLHLEDSGLEYRVRKVGFGGASASALNANIATILYQVSSSPAGIHFSHIQCGGRGLPDLTAPLDLRRPVTLSARRSSVKNR
jgi:hypothetical protein